MVNEIDLLVKELPEFIKKYGRYPRQNCGIGEEETLANRVSRVRKRAKITEREGAYLPLTQEDRLMLDDIYFAYNTKENKQKIDEFLENNML